MTVAPTQETIDKWKDRANRTRDPGYPACDLMDAARACEWVIKERDAKEGLYSDCYKSFCRVSDERDAVIRLLDSLLNKVNAVTAPWRHQDGVNAQEIDNLANRQIEVETALAKIKEGRP